MSDVERRARLAARHRLAPARRTDDVVAIADGVVALHSSDPVTVYLSATARMREPSLAAVEAALYDDRTLVRHHAMRRTLWVFGRETAPVAHAATTVAVATNERRKLLKVLAAHPDVGDAEGWLASAREQVLAALAADEPRTARELGEAVPSLRLPLEVTAGAPTQGAHTRVLLVLGFEGELVRARPTGSWINSQFRWARMSRWLPGGLRHDEPATAAAALVGRYLHAFGPATAVDVQWWTGWTARATSAALASSGAVRVALHDGATAWLAPDDLDSVATSEPWVALLPGLDPTVMGWKQRDWYLDPAMTPLLFDRNGNAGPTAWVDGRVVGGWVQRRDGTVAVRLLADVGAEPRAALDAAAESLESLFGPVRATVRFPAPLQAQLLA